MMHVALLLAAVSLAPLTGQAFGSLTGTVVDPLGAVLPDARVVLVQPARDARYEIRTDRTGRYEFPGLPGGDYQLEASSAGFETYRGTVTIAGAALRVPITLRIGRLHETIRIRESDPPAPLLAPPTFTEPACPAPPVANVGGAGSAPAIGGNLRPPRKLRDVHADYPLALRGTGRDATVVVDARIGLDGLLKDFEPREPVDPAFYDAVVLAAREWRFSATLLNCVPQEVDITITARFQHQSR